MRRLTELLVRFRRDERGVFAVFFAILAIVLIATAGAVVDFTSIQTNRSRAQTALDSAALALQTRIGIDNTTTLQGKAQLLLTQQINNPSVTATVTSVTVDTTVGKIDLSASVTAPTAFVRLVGITSLSANLVSEATEGSKDIEVAVALDITGSMAGTKLQDLKDAMNGTSTTTGLIDQVVQTSQTPTYSKMSIIPWTNSVNINTSSYASGYGMASVRGPEYMGATMTSATWINGTSKTISGITKASPAVVTTSAAHGFSTGDYIFVATSSGSPSGLVTNINQQIFKVGTKTSTTFQLLTTSGTNVNSSSWSSFSSSGTPKVSKCYNSTCQLLVTTSTAHNLNAGDDVLVTGASGTITSISPALNNSTSTYSPTVHSGKVGTVPTTTTYYLTDETATNVLYNTYTNSSGTSYCVRLGCYYYYFVPSSTYSHVLFNMSDCVSERTGTHAADDVAPSTAFVGYNYDASNNPCVTPALIPLSSNKTDLKSTVTSLVAASSTAGQMGLAWGWYMVSPNFAYLWPTASQPAAYGRANLVKAVVLMTDGDFNTAYCNSVIAKDSSSGSGNGYDHSNCNATNGSSGSQADDLCTAIKADNITLYTVGFDLNGDTTALNRLTNCATSGKFYQADTGTDLSNAFADIARNLNNLRLSK